MLRQLESRRQHIVCVCVIACFALAACGAPPAPKEDRSALNERAQDAERDLQRTLRREGRR